MAEQTIATVTVDDLAEALGFTLGELCLFLAEEAASEYEKAGASVRRGDDPRWHLERASHMRKAQRAADKLWDERNPGTEPS